MMKKRKFNKICFSLTLALALLVGAFVVVRVNADSLSEEVFDGSKVYGFQESNISPSHDILEYYTLVKSGGYDYVETASVDNNNIPWINIGDNLSDDFYQDQVDYFYSIIIPNTLVNTDFSIWFSNSIGGNIDILFSDNTYFNDHFDGTIYNYSAGTIPSNLTIIAIGFSNYTENAYARGISCNSSSIIGSDYYSSGYADGVVDGIVRGQANAQDTIDSLNLTIDDLRSQIETLEDRSIDMSFKGLLNHILNYPINMVKTVFYNNGEPITLFGVSLPGLLLGIFGIALSIGIIAVVKKVWK